MNTPLGMEIFYHKLSNVNVRIKKCKRQGLLTINFSQKINFIRQPYLITETILARYLFDMAKSDVAPFRRHLKWAMNKMMASKVM